jgi:glycosyltransferase involved in cell wall biosynthesis
MGDDKKQITALLITYNEIFHIDAVLDNISFADEIIVVDSLSTDGTAEKVRQRPNVKLIQRPFENFTDQKSFALQQASHDWILFLDADERVTEPLKEEITETINVEKPPANAYYFRRTFMFEDEVLHFSGWQSDKNYRLFRKSKVYFSEERIVHETLVINGKSGILKNKLIHYSYKNYEDYKGKMIKYGQMKAFEELDKDYTPNLYHFWFRPFYKFINHYFFRLGILDGKKGMIICYLNALGVHARYKELARLRKEKDIGQ